MCNLRTEDVGTLCKMSVAIEEKEEAIVSIETDFDVDPDIT